MLNIHPKRGAPQLGGHLVGVLAGHLAVHHHGLALEAVSGSVKRTRVDVDQVRLLKGPPVAHRFPLYRSAVVDASLAEDLVH